MKEPLKLDWTGRIWCVLRMTDGRAVDVGFWAIWKRMGRTLCVSCGHPEEEHEGSYPDPKKEGHCSYGNAGIYCGCKTLTLPPHLGVTLDTEVRFWGLTQIKNGTGRASRRHAYRGAKPNRTTTSKVRIYSTTLGGLLACAGSGVPLVLRAPNRYVQAGGVISAQEMCRLSLAVEAAMEAGEWSPTGTPRSAPAESMQLVMP